jgi:hypothetical protein
MTENNEGNPGQESDDIAPGTPGRVTERDENAPGAAGAGQEPDEELSWAKRHVPKEPGMHPERTVFRKTELHWTMPVFTPDDARKIRQRTIKNLKGPGATILYQPFEKAIRDFTNALIEHQDRVAREILLHIADLQQQIDLLERKLEQARQTPSGMPEVQT